MKPRPLVVTLGTFDGVHRGHQALLAKARSRADALGGDVAAVTFHRPPRLYFHPEPGPQILTTPDEKEALLRRYGVDKVLSLTFDRALSQVSAAEFMERYLRRRWKAREIVVGFNFTFGCGGAGDVAFLRREGRRRGIRCHAVAPQRAGGRLVSSGAVRGLIRWGKVAEAARLTGHPYLIAAPVVRGRGMGRTLGYPTANLAPSRDKILPLGVYAARVTLPSGTPRLGLLNVGWRPTVAKNLSLSTEVHILDFQGDLVGQTLRLELLAGLRGERRFPSLRALARQLAKDEKKARRLPW